jgi:hexosaminidase
MKLLKLFAISLFFGLILNTTSHCQKFETKYAVIPQPVSVMPDDQWYSITPGTCIIITSELFREAGNNLSKQLSTLTGYDVRCVTKEATNSICFQPEPGKLKEEEYQISISKKRIEVRVAGPKGAFYAVQTLMQLLQTDHLKNGDTRFKIPGCKIIDYPLYTYRGFHLDVSRHFFTKEYIFQLIDWLSYYKFNKLQLHLTDDQGWRIEIDQFPLLTSIGAWRSFNNLDSICMEKTITDPDFEIDKRFINEVNGNKTYGGFYTKNDIREIIAYASAHYIDVIPEIDMPGHMSAAISAYPFLSCTGARGWGKEFSYPICPCKEEVMDFCFKVWDEIADLFPYNVVHIGSDEVEKDTWAASAVCQQFMKENNMTDLNEIQNYYVNRIQQHLQLKGKTVIAWDDVIEGKVDSNLTLMYWRDWLKDSPAKCAQNGNNIILTPWSQFYLSGRHTDTTFEELYNYNPTDSLSAGILKKIIGIQGCVWTEEIPSEAKFEYHVFPRLQALSEVCWSSERNWGSFKARLEPHLKFMDAKSINYRNPGWRK